MDLSFILSPPFLVNNISVIALVLAGFVLVMFDNFVTEQIFKLADIIREGSAKGLKRFGKTARYLSEFLATFMILFYCYFGTIILARHLFGPILTSLREILLIVIIVLFLLISYTVNTKSIRKLLREM